MHEMEKNGGSCAGKQRFHVFVTDSLFYSGKMRLSLGPNAVLQAGGR